MFTKRAGMAVLLVAILLAATIVEASVTLPGVRNNRIDFLNWEGLGLGAWGVDAAPSDDGTGNPGAIGQIDVGDTLDGILQAQDVALGLGGLPDIFTIGPGNPALTGFFSIEVTSKTPLTGGGYIFGFGANPAFASAFPGLASGSMLALYEETGATAQDLTITGTHAANISTITDGTLVLDLGIGSSADYWISRAGTDVPASLGGSTEFFYGLSALGGSVAPFVTPQLSPFMSALDPVQAPYAGNINDFVGEGDITPLLGNPTYNIQSDDPALVQVIPEPSAMLVWGFMAFCALTAKRIVRRRRK